MSDLRDHFAAAGTDFAREVGKSVEVKGDWWEGGTASERRSWWKVTVMEYSKSHDFEVQRKHQPKTTRTAPALRIRLETAQDDSEDAWMVRCSRQISRSRLRPLYSVCAQDCAQYVKYKRIHEEKLKQNAIREKARAAIEGGMKQNADGGGAAADAGDDDVTSMDPPELSLAEKKEKYKSVVALLFDCTNQYRVAKGGDKHALHCDSNLTPATCARAPTPSREIWLMGI